MVEEFTEQDHYEMLKDWWAAHGQPAIPIDCLPTYGLVAPGRAAGFLIITDCNLGLLEFFVSNPNTSADKRNAALDEITSGLLNYGQSVGITNFKADTQSNAIKRRAEKHGFKYIGEFSNYFLTREG